MACFFLLIFVIAVSGPCGRAQVVKSPNSLLILADDMGHGDLGSSNPKSECSTALLATFSDICGKPLPANAGPDSFGFLRVMEDRQPKDQPVRAPIVMQAGNFSTGSIRSGDWKPTNQPGSGGFSKPAKIQPEPGGPAGQLYNPRDDPAETRNLYSEYPDIVARLGAEMKRIRKSGHGR